MTVITITREARCEDCKHLGDKYIGKRKRIWCNKLDKYTGRKDNAGRCIDNGDFIWIYDKNK